MSQLEEEYDTEPGLDTRPNTSGPYTTYVKGLRDMEEDKSCLGRMRRWSWKFYVFLLKLQYLLSDFIVIMVTSGVFYTGVKQGNDDETAFVKASACGVLAMFVLNFFTWLSRKASVFEETSQVHVVNETHWSLFVVFWLVHILPLIFVISMIARINQYCEKEKHPCAYMNAFSIKNLL